MKPLLTEQQKIRKKLDSNPYSSFLKSEWIILIILTIFAFIPRLVLALQLDASTDEPIYVTAGNWYILLSRHLNITDPNWLYNNEHPAFAKLLMGISVYISHHFHAPNMLFPARIPSVLLGTVFILAIYALGHAPFGRTIALLAALSLAFSPWIVYFSSMAILDMTMTTFITLAYLLIWHALRHPSLYALSGIFIGLAGASKYPAILVVPAILLFILYYYIILYPKLPTEQKSPLPWRWWLLGICLIPISFFLADPPIWIDPVHRLLNSLQFSLGHADTGHVTFWAGQIYTHVPPWMIFYVLFAKVSTFITLPALFFILFACIQIARFHLPRRQKYADPLNTTQINNIASIMFLFIWLIDSLVLFGQLTILVGTHYYLPVAAPLFLAGAFGLTIIVRTLIMRIRVDHKVQKPQIRIQPKHSNWQTILPFVLLSLALVGPHLLGLITIPNADGYTSEFFKGENSSLEVMYTGYHDADRWLMQHSKTGGSVGIVGGSATVLWYISNSRTEGTFQFKVTTYGNKQFPFDYLVWPMNLIQRKWGPPPPWNMHVVHIITGGDTTYCLIMARDPSSVNP